MPTQSTQREPGQKKRGWFFGISGLPNESGTHINATSVRRETHRARSDRGHAEPAQGAVHGRDLPASHDQRDAPPRPQELAHRFRRSARRAVQVVRRVRVVAVVHLRQRAQERHLAVLGEQVVEADEEVVTTSLREGARSEAGVLRRHRQHRRGVLGARVGQTERQPVEGRVARVPRDEVVEHRGVLPGLPLEVHDVRLAVAALAAPVHLPLGWDVRGGARRGRDEGEDQRGGCEGQKRAHRAASVTPGPANVENRYGACGRVRV